jgi:hypothetical protein
MALGVPLDVPFRLFILKKIVSGGMPGVEVLFAARFFKYKKFSGHANIP